MTNGQILNGSQKTTVFPASFQ